MSNGEMGGTFDRSGLGRLSAMRFKCCFALICVVSDVNVETLEKQFVDEKKLVMLKQKLQEIGIDGSSCKPGQYNGLVCPSVCDF